MTRRPPSQTMQSAANPSTFEATARATEGPDPDVPEFERYRFERVLGVGGMGQVTAVRDQRLDRVVALKEVQRRGPDGTRPSAPALENQLAREAWLTARLDHPSILPVHDMGTREDGSVYYTMPVARGVSLARHLRDADRLSLLRPFVQACEAVAHAHRLGVVHRDLKPDNIMVVDGGARVVDWGLACLVDEPVAVRAARVGTPGHMSPEQQRGEPVDVRTDVWGLGEILRQLLCGRDPAYPSDAPIELVAIAKRALAAPTGDRYEDAGAMAKDLVRYLDGRRVRAHAYSPRELLVRLMRAWRGPLIVALVAVVAISTLVVLGVQRLAAEKDRAIFAEQQSSQALVSASRDLSLLLSSQAVLFAERGARPEAEILAAHALEARESAQARGVLSRLGASSRPRLMARTALPGCGGLDVDGAEMLCRTGETVERWVIGPGGTTRQVLGPARSAVFADGTIVLHDGLNVHVLDRETGAERHQEYVRCGDQLQAIGKRVFAARSHCAWTIDTTSLADGPARSHTSTCGDAFITTAALLSEDSWAVACSDGHIRLGGRDERRLEVPFVSPHIVMAMAPLSEREIALGTNRGEIRILDRVSGRIVAGFETDFDHVTTLVPLPAAGRSKHLLIDGATGLPQVFDALHGVRHTSLPAGLRTFFGVRDGELLEADAHELRRWKIESRHPGTLRLPSGVSTLAFDDGSQKLAIGHAEGLEVRELNSGVPWFERHAMPVIKGLAFDTGSLTLQAVTANPTPDRTFDLEHGALLPDFDPIVTAGMQRLDGRRIGRLANGWFVVIHYYHGVKVFPPGEPAPWAALTDLMVRFSDLATVGDQVVLLEERSPRVWWLDVASQTVAPILEQAGAVSVAVGPGLDLIALGGDDQITLWDGELGVVLGVLQLPGHSVTRVGLSPDGRWLAAGGRDGSVWVWGTRTLEQKTRSSPHRDRVAAIVFSPDGRLLASGSWDGTVQLHALEALTVERAGLGARLETAWGIGLEAILARTGLTR